MVCLIFFTEQGKTGKKKKIKQPNGQKRNKNEVTKICNEPNFSISKVIAFHKIFYSMLASPNRL